MESRQLQTEGSDYEESPEVSEWVCIRNSRCPGYQTRVAREVRREVGRSREDVVGSGKKFAGSGQGKGTGRFAFFVCLFCFVLVTPDRKSVV